MYPMLPLGPLSIPTAPMMALFAVIIGLDVLTRYGRRLGMNPDQLWNCSMWAIFVGLIVARLWNVGQFWPIYLEEPLLALSPRPSGFALWPGLVGALITGYGYLLYHALDPVRTAVALMMGMITAGIIFSISGWLTGKLTGAPTELPWALWYYGELQHPVAFYRAVGLLMLLVGLWTQSHTAHPAHLLWLGSLGYSLLHFITESFVANPALIGSIRLWQVGAWLLALFCCVQLGRYRDGDILRE